MKATTQNYKGIKLVTHKEVNGYRVFAFNAGEIKAVSEEFSTLKRDAIELMKIKIDHNDYNKFKTI